MGKWEMVRLEDVSEGKSSNIAQKGLEKNEGAYPIFGASGLIKYVNFYKYDSEYIAIVKDGAGIGRTILCPAKSSVIGTMQVVLPKSLVNPRYLYYAISGMNLARYYTGATIPHIYYKDYKSELLVLPPLPIQKQIAGVLDRVSALIEKRKAQIDKLDLLVKSQFIEMFGDPVKNPMGWKIEPVINVCDCMVPGRNKPKSFTGKIPWITIDDLQILGITFKSKQNLGLTMGEINEVKRRTIPLNSVIISCVGNLGIVSIAGTEMIINQQLHSFQCRDTVHPIFLMYELSLKKTYMDRMATSTTVAYMNKRVCNSIPIRIPPLVLQNQFADFVHQVESKKKTLQKSLAKLELQYKSLMQKCFRGEIF